MDVHGMCQNIAKPETAAKLRFIGRLRQKYGLGRLPE
jgi:hypothetical protein